MVDDAATAGAECVKFQCHIIEDEMIPNDVVPGNATESIWDIMDRCTLTESEELRLKEHVEAAGMIYLSTPFSRAAADRLHSFDVPAYKIGSGECNNYPLVEHIAGFGKPVILSTGMNDLESIAPVGGDSPRRRCRIRPPPLHLDVSHALRQGATRRPSRAGREVPGCGVGSERPLARASTPASGRYPSVRESSRSTSPPTRPGLGRTCRSRSIRESSNNCRRRERVFEALGRPQEHSRRGAADDRFRLLVRGLHRRHRRWRQN